MGFSVRKTSAALAAILLLGALSSALAYDSLNMRIVGRWPFTGCQLGVGDTARNLCFAACGGGVYVLDITDPANPQKLSERIQTGGIVRDLYFDHDLSRLYVACEEGGLELWDVRTATAPYRLGVSSGLQHAWSVVVESFRAYVANREDGLAILDVSDPSQPEVLSQPDTPGDARDVSVQSGRAYVADSNSLRILDVTNPRAPVETGRVDNVFVETVVARDTCLYVCTYDSTSVVRVYGISNPDHPNALGSCPITSRGLDIAIVGSYVYAACHYFGLNIIDITNSRSPVRTGAMGLGWGTNIKVTGSHGYAMGSELVFLDVANPGSPSNVGYFHNSSLFGGVAVQGDYAYLTTWDGLIVVNIADPSYTFEVGRVGIAGEPTDVVVQGDYAYVGSQGDGTSVVDVSDPANPRVLATVIDHAYCERLVVRDTLVFVAGQLGVPIIDVSDPTNPLIVGLFNTVPFAYGIDATDNLMLVADGMPSGGLRVVDVTVPSQPRLLGTAPTGNYTNDVAVDGTLAYTVALSGGVRVVDITSPASPEVIGSLALTGQPKYIDVTRGFLYVATSERGIQVLDVSDPGNPREVGSHSRPSARRGIAACQGLAYVVDGGLGLVVLQNQLYGIEELPPSLVIHFDVRLVGSPVTDGRLKLDVGHESPGGWRLTIYDATGRRARTFEAAARCGQVELDVSGLVSGVYHLVAASARRSRTLKVTILTGP